jgi:hypothetical protein
MNLNQTFKDINTWFNVNLLTLNFNKTQYVEFRYKNYYNITTQINYDQKSISNVTETKFLGLIIDSTLSWKQHTDQVTNKISTACYALRNIKYIVPLDMLRLIYFAHIHSIISYGIIFWGGFSCANKVFILQKKITGIITNTRPGDSCREIFKKME